MKLLLDQQPADNQPSYFMYSQHNVTLIRSPQFGYGLAITGGLDTTHNNKPTNSDPSIYVSDIVSGGPAEGKLSPNDKLLSINGVGVEQVEHSFAIRLLKEAREFIHLVVRRRIVEKGAILKGEEANANANGLGTLRRCNQAILQTANSLLDNFNSPNNSNRHSATKTNDEVVVLPVPLLKPIKVTLSRKDKREGFGLVLGCKFYIKDIVGGSLASSEANLRKGDVLIKMNDLGMEQLSLGEARKMLVKSSKLHLAVKRNSLLNDCEGDLESGSDDVVSSCSSGEKETEKEKMVAKDAVDNSNGGGHRLLTKQLFKPISSSGQQKLYARTETNLLNVRTVRFARENGIGIRLAGGNKVGIFICDVQYGSPAERAGLKIADKILHVNNADYSTLTREQAVHHILLIQHSIDMQVALCQTEYEQHAFDPLGGDSFYVRAHFNFDSPNPVDLSFRINDVLHVTDTLYNGVMGQWVATKIGRGEGKEKRNGQKQERGTIPNQVSAEQLSETADTIDTLSTQHNPLTNINLHTIGASARMSIRKKLAKSTLTKRSKSATRSITTNANSDTEPESTTNTTTPKVKVSKANTFAASKYPAYERIVLKEVNFIRPVVLFGAMADIARDKLKQDMPHIFQVPDSYSNDQSNSSGVIKLASIKAIIDSGRHCLLDITPNAVEHLNYAQYFPICVYLKSDSCGQVKELRAKCAVKGQKVKSSKRLYENACRLDKFYSHLFTGEVGVEQSGWVDKLKEMVEMEQRRPLWISQELEEILMGSTAGTTDSPVTTSPNDYDHSFQQQKFLTKQTQLLKSQPQNNQQPTTNFIFDDNFELALNSMHQFNSNGLVSGAQSTYSLYEDQNYRSSLAASDSDINPNTNNYNPIYSTNYTGRSNYGQRRDQLPTSDYGQPQESYGGYRPKDAFIQKTDQSQSQRNYSEYVASQVEPVKSNRNGQFGSNGGNYKLIKNSGSSLMCQSAAIADSSMHYTDLQDKEVVVPESETSLVEKLNMLKMGESIGVVNGGDIISQQVHQYNQPQSTFQQKQPNTNTTSTDHLARPKKQPPTKPPPPTLPKPKFHLPSTPLTNLILTRNLKAKSELNIATTTNYQNQQPLSSGLSNSTTSSVKDLDIPQGITQHARNKLQTTNTSDTWNLGMEVPQQLNPARFKHFQNNNNDNNNKPTNNSVQVDTSDASLNGISGDDTDSIPAQHLGGYKVKQSTNNTSSSSASCSSTSSAAAISGATTLSSASGCSVFGQKIGTVGLDAIKDSPSQGQRVKAVELPIYYEGCEGGLVGGRRENEYVKSPIGEDGNKGKGIIMGRSPSNSNDSYTDLYTSTNEALKYTRPQTSSTYTAHYNDNGTYRQLALDSSSNCSIIASANGIFDSNGGCLESADTGVAINVPEGAIAAGYSFDLYFKVCHCKSNITNGKGDLLTNPIVMCGPRGVKFLKPIELQIPHFISIDGQSWSYAFKTCDLDDSFNFSRFQKKTLINSVTVEIEGF